MANVALDMIALADRASGLRNSRPAAQSAYGRAALDALLGPTILGTPERHRSTRTLPPAHSVTKLASVGLAEDSIWASPERSWMAQRWLHN
jgi:hypothetical protein